MTDPGSEPLVDTDVLGDVLPVEDGMLEEESERLPASDSGVGVVRLMSVIRQMILRESGRNGHLPV
jgi:hypothetical protein